MKSIQFAAALSLGVPAAALAEQPPICTDRPAKANSVCTVPAGRIQLETAMADWIGTDAAGTRTDSWAIAPSLLKLGLSSRSDLELGFTPYLDVRVKQPGPDTHASGFGDVVIRYKHRLTADDAKVQVAAVPFVKLPVARRALGNGKVEAGLALPITVATGSAITVVLGPEVDLLADSDGRGRHVQLVNLVNLSAPVAPRLTLAGELWTATNFDPAESVTQISADAALAYSLSNDLQLDLGGNFGLNRNTPEVELYAGFSIRF